MCGRYEFALTDSEKSRQILERTQILNLIYKQGEIFPTDKVLCVIPKESKIDLTTMTWGIKHKSLQINARKESIADRYSYHEMKNKRCAVISNGFYEWDKDKNKYYINTNDEFIYLACIFNENNELLIITQSADDSFNNIHDRMPIIMSEDEMIKFVHNEDTMIDKKNLNITKDETDIRLF